MAIKKEETKNIKLSGKGILLDVTEDGLIIEDEKSGDQETFLLDDIRALIGKSITIAVANKQEVEPEEE